MAYAKRRVTADGRIRFTAVYLDPAERERSAGTFDAKRIAERTARAAEQAVREGGWIDPSKGKIRFRDYVEQHWWPSRHLELSTRAAYRSYLDRHFIPYFGEKPMSAIAPSTVQAWVTSACAAGLAPRSVVKYHVMLHSIFKRAVRDRVIVRNPCAETELPKVVAKRLRILSPEEFDRLLEFVPARYVPMVLTEIETGLRWGELIALRPQDIDFLRRVIAVDRVVVEVSRKISPTAERMVIKDYPKDNEPRSVRVSRELIQTVSLHMQTLKLQTDDLLFSSTGRAGGRPISRNTFRTRIWLPALEKAQLGFHVRFHDLRHAHASWALAGGADLKAVMDRLGHAQITTTQRYLHTLPESDEQALAAFGRTRTRSAAKHESRVAVGMRDTGIVSESRVSYRDVRPIIVAASLAELTGPTAGVFELPRNLVWSGQASFDFGDDQGLLTAYKIVLVESMRVEYLQQWLNEAALRRLWPQLGLPVAVRDRWQQAFPELAG